MVFPPPAPGRPPIRKSSMKHQLSIMDHTGHTAVTWDPDNDESIKTAEEMFKTLKDKGYRAYKAGPKGGRIYSFDKALGEIVMTPPLSGG